MNIKLGTITSGFIPTIPETTKDNITFKLEIIKIKSDIIWKSWLGFTSSTIKINSRKGEMTINKLIAILLGLLIVALTASLFISLKSKATDSINCICTPAYSGEVPPGCPSTVVCP